MKKKIFKPPPENKETQYSGLQPEEILESITDAFYAVDTDWRLTYINHRAEEWWRRRREELLGTVLWDMFPEPEKTVGWQLHHQAMGERVPVHWETFSPNLKVWVDANAYPTSDGGIAVYFRDITERKKTEEVLRASEEKYRAIVETAGEGITIARPEGNYFYVNQRMADMLGYPADEILGKSNSDFTFDECRPQVLQARKDLRQGNVINGEFKFRRKDGSVMWTMYNATPMFNENGEHIANLAMHTNITARKLAEEKLKQAHDELERRILERTLELQHSNETLKTEIEERKRTEQALRESREKYQALIETTGEFIWETDVQGRYTYCSPQMEKLWGIKPEEMLGKTPFDVMPSEEKKNILKNL